MPTTAIPLDPASRAKGEDRPAAPRTKSDGDPPSYHGKAATPRARGNDVRQEVLCLADTGFDAPAALLARYGLELMRVGDGKAIPGCYWGEPEAGVIASRVYARRDTPLHSLLHEACHLLVADPMRRASIDTDASDSTEEEDATCYLQIVLSDRIPGFGRERAFTDMDAWGYSFRLGSARAWFEHDAEDARAFIERCTWLDGILVAGTSATP